jgi:hypothetical protein
MKTQKLTTQRGDTCWLDIPIPKNFQYDESLFNSKMTLDDNGVIISDVKLLKDTPRKSIFGLNNVGIINDKIELKFSGKILGDDYFEGITLDTIPTVVKEINKVTGMNISVDGILTESTMRTFDNTFNILLDETDKIGEYVKSLNFGSVGTQKLGVTGYGDDSVVFKLDTTSTKNRIIFYNKLVEIQSKDKEFYRIYNTDRFIDTLRCELNVVGLEKMRNFYNIPTYKKPSLGDILTSKNNCISKQFSRFVDIKSSQQLLFSVDNLKSMEYKDKREMHQRFFIEYHYNLFKGNVDKIFELYKETYSDGRVPSREKSIVKKMVKQIENKKISKKTKLIYTDKFNEINKKLQTL